MKTVTLRSRHGMHTVSVITKERLVRKYRFFKISQALAFISIVKRV